MTGCSRTARTSSEFATPAQAIKKHGQSQNTKLFGHNVTATKRQCHMKGSMKAVIQQDLKRTTQQAIQTLLSQRHPAMQGDL